jgi:hypothetical protein
MSAIFALAAQAVPLPMPVMEPRWPEEYRCRVVTDETEMLEFSLRLTDREMTFDREIFSIDRNAMVALAKVGVGLKSGDSFSRTLASTELPNGRIWITQLGTPANPSTQIFVDLGGKDQPAAQRRPQATGYCAVASGAKETTQ